MSEARLYSSFEETGITGIKLLGGRNIQYTTCPECSPGREKKDDPCLEVKLDKCYFKCFHCGDFWGYWNAEPKHEKSDSKAEKKTFIKATPIPMSKSGYSYFEKRGISQKTIDLLKVTMAKDVYFVGPKITLNAICFNYYDNDRLTGTKYRNSKDGKEKLYQNSGGFKSLLYNYDNFRTAEEGIICEGEMDAATWVEAGFLASASVPTGAVQEKADPAKMDFQYLNNCEVGIKNKKRIYLSCDNDITGQLLKEELARRIGKHLIYLIVLPEDCKDANDVLKNYGHDQGVEILQNCLANAKPYPIKGIYTVMDVEEGYERLYNEGYPKGWITKECPQVDKHYVCHRGKLSVHTGCPGMGKTTMRLFLMMLWAKNSEMRFGMFSPENGGTDYMMAIITQQYLGKPFFPGNGNRVTIEEKEMAKEWLKDHFFEIRPDSREFTLDKILELAKDKIYYDGIDALDIDPYSSIIYTDLLKNYDKRDIVNVFLNTLGEFAYVNGIHANVTAHPRKMPLEKNKHGLWVPQCPTPFDISESKDWFGIPDVCSCTHKYFKLDEFGNRIDDYTSFNIQKQRFPWVSKEGTIKFSFDSRTSRFTEIPWSGKTAEPVEETQQNYTSYYEKSENDYDEEYERKVIYGPEPELF